ncbi:MAG: DUF501 domain-containing protein [Candidatus Nanopelagicales bacterium]
MTADPPVSGSDLDMLAAQLGRTPRGAIAVPARCGDGWPAVVATVPRLDDGTPFPTFYYLTCRRLHSSLSTLESEGLMREYAQKLVDDDQFAEQYRRAHQQYLTDREAIAVVDEIADYSAGGMPDRVKCLHALVGHSLAAGPGVNPVGDLALAEVARRGLWPHTGPCVVEDHGE